MNIIWQTLLIFIIGSALLRVSGRKTISEMTMPQTIIMLMLGTLLIDPVSGNGLWTTFGVAALLLFTLMVTEYFQLKSDKIETIISGKAISVIENGMINENNMSKLRLTVEQLEERLRQKGISSIADVQMATMEVNGQLGYHLKENKQPATKEDIQQLVQLIQNGYQNEEKKSRIKDNIFSEMVEKEKSDSANYLQ